MNWLLVRKDCWLWSLDSDCTGLPQQSNWSHVALGIYCLWPRTLCWRCGSDNAVFQLSQTPVTERGLMTPWADQWRLLFIWILIYERLNNQFHKTRNVEWRKFLIWLTTIRLIYFMHSLWQSHPQHNHWQQYLNNLHFDNCIYIIYIRFNQQYMSWMNILLQFN